ncbi:uncharacterized protein LOC112686919 [Sipha flava]|uniref:Uncharacterized protein LOC112686919 n=1 Tax=Sipha flava TaxID=143950 RepID=A0A8B8FXF6_9HEMI|nr:uncharacterized protein LOC112686919 [Sipha flava]
MLPMWEEAQYSYMPSQRVGMFFIDMKRMQSKINSILASYRNTPTTSTSCSPTELINKFKPKNHLSVLKPPCVVDNNKINIVIKYEINDKVLVSNNSKGQK